ncbi:dipeptidase [Marinilongibacter aquaticus]|uniref:dipeptidase n=1 Tax=Marinilongibacter aquaticus TaxID=2975157 RepID=UPI0021BD4B22|nr:dipeptidase [Marinilongibacter aquaticus]UBM60454.1 dipeptidase [Marinilongibacter aquaticus]
MFIFDAHLDLSMNAMEWNRDLTLPLATIRRREKDLNDKPDRAKGTVCFPEMHKGNVGLCVATLIARTIKQNSTLPGWYSQQQAFAQVQGQLAWYREMERKEQMRQIVSKVQLDEHLADWNEEESYSPIGYILSIEGADSIVDLEHLEQLHSQGLRAVGMSHYGVGVYAFGTDSDGRLPQKGKALLKKINELGIILDVTHLSDKCFYDALDLNDGPVWASHHLCRRITPHNRQLSDDMIRSLLEVDAVIGMAMDAWMVVPNWIRGFSTPKNMKANRDRLVDHMLHIANIAGTTKNIMIGSDLDGAFGIEQTPMGIKSIADIQKLAVNMEKRGFSQEEIEGIFWKNGVDFLRKNLD